MATLRLRSNHASRYQLHPSLSSGTVFVYRLWLQQKRRDWLFINKRDDLFLVLKSRGLVLASAWLVWRPSWQKAEEKQCARERWHSERGNKGSQGILMCFRNSICTCTNQSILPEWKLRTNHWSFLISNSVWILLHCYTGAEAQDKLSWKQTIGKTQQCQCQGQLINNSAPETSLV